MVFWKLHNCRSTQPNLGAPDAKALEMSQIFGAQLQ